MRDHIAGLATDRQISLTAPCGPWASLATLRYGQPFRIFAAAAKLKAFRMTVRRT